MIAALHQKLREGAITRFSMLKAHDQLFKEIESGRILCVAFTRPTIDHVEAAFRNLPETVLLRAGDAVHLATASEAGFKEIYFNDRHLLKAAPLFKLKGINPLVR